MGLSDGKTVALTKKEYGSAVQFLKVFMQSSKSISDEWFNAIWWSSPLFEIFIMKSG